VIFIGYDNFGVSNDFISMGFTSFSYIQLISKIFDKYSVEIKLIPLLKNGGTIKDIAKQINESTIDSFKHDKQEFYPLSPDHIYFLSMLNNDYNDIFDTSNLSFCVSFNAEVYDVYKLKDALIKTIDINSFVKTYVLVKPNMTLYLKNNNEYKVDIEVHKKILTEDIINDFFKGEFNLLKSLLFKFEFYFDDKNIFLLLDMHHGVSDFYSIHILLNELIRVYNGENFSKDYDYYDYILDYNKNTPKENILKLKKGQIVSMFKGELVNLFKKELSKVTGKFLNKLEDEKRGCLTIIILKNDFYKNFLISLNKK
jgi:hypothetical protein